MYPFNPLLTRSNFALFYIPLARQREIADWVGATNSPRIGFLNQPLAADITTELKQCGCTLLDGVFCSGMVVAGVWFEYVGSDGNPRNYYLLTDQLPKSKFVPAPANDGTLRLQLPLTLKINNCEIPVELTGVCGITSTTIQVTCSVPETAVEALRFVGYDLKATWTTLRANIS